MSGSGSSKGFLGKITQKGKGLVKSVAKKKKPTPPHSTPSSTPSVTNYNTFNPDETFPDYLERELEEREESPEEMEDIYEEEAEEPIVPSQPMPRRSRKTPRMEDEQEDEEHAEAEAEESHVHGGGKAKSFVWNFFTKVQSGEDPKSFTTKCSRCQVAYKWRTGSGTGTQKRHLETKHGINEENWSSGGMRGSGSRQTQLHGFCTDMPGGGTPFNYRKDSMIKGFSKFIIGDELPFVTSESSNFEEFARTELQPQFRKVPRNTLKHNTIARFKEQQFQLIEMFSTLSSRVSLTTDAWTCHIGRESFICVTAHWIDAEWFLQKRIIAFEGMPERHTGFNIQRRVKKICKQYKLLKNLFSLSVDNATANTKCIEYMLEDPDFDFVLGGTFLHVRCCAHILNLSAQEGIKTLGPLIEPIRKIIYWLRNGGRGIKRKYKNLCAQQQLPKKIWNSDTPTRWNSTYNMLTQAVRYRTVFTTLYNDCVTDDSDRITDFHWKVAYDILPLLKAYDSATNVFSLVYLPNSQSVILLCTQIIKQLEEVENNDNTLALKPVLKAMKDKWLTYFLEFPKIYGIATLLDPTQRKYGLEILLDNYYSALGINYDVTQYINDCVATLGNLYDLYMSAHNPGGTTPSSSTQLNEVPFSAQFIANLASTTSSRSSRTQKTVASNSVPGLEEYFNTQFEIRGNFQILEWWRSKESTFPIVAKIARDILAIPASTVASESAFSAGRRVLDEKRSRLGVEMIRICVCKKDWDAADKRTQGLRLDREDEDDPFMLLDTDSSGGPLSDEDEG